MILKDWFRKGRGKGKVRPVARALDWDGDQDYPDHEDYPDDDQDQEQDPPEDAEGDEPYDDDGWFNQGPDEQEQPGNE